MRRFEFDGYVVDAIRRTVHRGTEPVALTAKAFDTLVFLLENRGRTATKHEIMDAVWRDIAVEENNLTQQISTLRKAFGETPGQHRFIVTVPGKGYSFIPEVSEPTFAGPRSMGYSFAAQLAFAGAVLLMSVSIALMMFAASRTQVRPTLAVLPFHSVDGVDDSLGAGMRYTLTAKLGDMHDVLDVRPAGVVPHADPLVAGRELAVDAVLDGTIQHAGDRVRVTIQMVDVSHGRVLWARNIDALAAESFAAQDAVANEVAAGLTAIYARS
jgi:DNA-binding winged helix-turn-helix (wHTH) protein/TolB-like protein